MKSIPSLQRCTGLTFASAVFCGVLLLMLAGCSPTERVIDNTNPTYTLYAAADGGDINTTLQPANASVAQALFRQANGESLAGTVTLIKRFRNDTLYLMIPSAKRIEVVNEKTFKRIATISTAPRTPVDMCFSNSSTAFVANNDSTVSVIDITVFRAVRDITVGKNPVAIASVENRVCVCNRDDNTISIIQTNGVSSYTVLQTIPAGTAPSFVAPDFDKQEFVIVSRGAGKVSGSELRTPAELMYYNIKTNTLSQPVTLNQLGANPEDVDPSGLITAQGEIGFIMLDGEITVLDTRGNSFLSAIGTDGRYSLASYNDFRRDIVFATKPGAGSGEPTRCINVDVITLGVKSRFTLPYAAMAIAH